MAAAVNDEDVLSKVQIEPAPAIIRTRQQAREIDGQHVEVLSMGYTDRIMINVATEGKIGHLVAHIFQSQANCRYRYRYPIHYLPTTL